MTPTSHRAFSRSPLTQPLALGPRFRGDEREFRTGRRHALAAAVIAWSLACTLAQAAYPERLITLIVPFPAGGPSDIIARIVSVGLQRSLGQSVIVDNRGGGGGNPGMGIAARAAADGYTLLLTSTAIAVNPALYKSLPYDPLTDFAPVEPLIKDGKFTALAVTGAERWFSLPDVPTMIESGFPGFVSDTFNALFAPAGTAPEIIALLSSAVRAALKTPEAREQAHRAGYQIVGGTPEELAARLASEIPAVK